MRIKLFFSVFIFYSLTIFAQSVPVMGPILGASTVCSAPGIPPTYSVSASNSPAGYFWSVSPSLGVIISNPNSSTTSISFPNTNTVYVISCSAINAAGPSAQSSTFSTIVFETPQVTFSGASAFCQGSPTNIQASPTTISASSTISYSWIPATGLSATNIGNPIANPTTTTVYTVNYAIGSCSNSALFTASVNALPQLNLSATNFTICPYQSYNIGINTTATSYSLNGLPISSTSTIYTVNPLGAISPGAYSYLFSGSDNLGCTSFATSLFTVNPSPIINAIVSKTVLCQNETATLSILGSAINYSVNGFATSTPTIINGNMAPLIIVGTNGFGCQASINVPLSVSSLPQVNATISKNAICKNETTTLTISGSANGYSLNGIATVNNNLAILGGTMALGFYNYTVTGIANSGCVKSVTTSLTISACLGLNDFNSKNESSIHVYPNPSKGTIYFESNTTQELILMDELGRSIYKFQLEKDSTQLISDLAPGIYFLKGHQEFKKIIITE